jgi:hypothetical protein
MTGRIKANIDVLVVFYFYDAFSFRLWSAFLTLTNLQHLKINFAAYIYMNDNNDKNYLKFFLLKGIDFLLLIVLPIHYKINLENFKVYKLY